MAPRLYFGHVTLPRLIFESNFGPAERPVASTFPLEIGWGENLAANRDFGGRSARVALQGWFNSASHPAAILNTNFRVGGVGCAEDARGQISYCQEFATDDGDLPIINRNDGLFRHSTN